MDTFTVSRRLYRGFTLIELFAWYKERVPYLPVR